MYWAEYQRSVGYEGTYQGWNNPAVLAIAEDVAGLEWYADACGWLANFYVGFLGFGGFGDDLVSTIARIPMLREVLLSGKISNGSVRKLINAVVREESVFGNGSAMDALRFERSSGQLLSAHGHAGKNINSYNRVLKLLKDPTLNDDERAVLMFIKSEIEAINPW